MNETGRYDLPGGWYLVRDDEKESGPHYRQWFLSSPDDAGRPGSGIWVAKFWDGAEAGAVDAKAFAASLQSSAVEGVGPFCQKCKGPWRHKPEPHCDHNCTPYWNPNPAETNALQQALNPSPTRADTVEECARVAEAHKGRAERDRQTKHGKRHAFMSDEAWASIRDEERGETIASELIAANIRALSQTKGEKT